jgi:hypothetical protein
MRRLRGTLTGALTGGAAVFVLIHALGAVIPHEVEAVSTGAAPGAAIGLALASVRRPILAGGAAAAAGIGAFAAAVWLFSGHLPWDDAWPPSAILLQEGTWGLARHALVLGLALAAGQTASRRAAVAALVSVAGVALSLVLEGEAWLAAPLPALVPLVALASLVSHVLLPERNPCSPGSSSPSCSPSSP